MSCIFRVAVAFYVMGMMGVGFLVAWLMCFRTVAAMICIFVPIFVVILVWSVFRSLLVLLRCVRSVLGEAEALHLVVIYVFVERSVYTGFQSRGGLGRPYCFAWGAGQFCDRVDSVMYSQCITVYEGKYSIKGRTQQTDFHQEEKHGQSGTLDKNCTLMK